jgi:hypothetical protein
MRPTQDIRADARFNALVKKQQLEHEALIDGHNKEMQALRDNLSLAMEKFASLSEKNVQDLKEFKTYAVCTFGVLNQRVIAAEVLASDQWKTIQDLHEQLQSCHVIFSSKADVEKTKRAMEERIKDCAETNIDSFQDFQRDYKGLVQGLKNELICLRSDLEERVARFTDDFENKLYIARIDKEGLLKELRVYKADMFVIEKKIENIYTLIERINKRGSQ